MCIRDSCYTVSSNLESTRWHYLSPSAWLAYGHSLILSGIYTFFVFAVDYSRTEYVQFEDDDYYYYVKAVPKLTVSTPDVKVQKINARKLQRPQR